jgi:peroxiredoxin
MDELTEGGTGGAESPLVGKPAPNVDLELLDGGRFKLGDCRGQIVILDFWATWCGPCLQSLPHVVEIADEFRDQGVRFVAVNLEEPAAQINACLARHDLTMTVALDKTGAVAAAYEASAIPQTVVIDKDGTIARLFVGGGTQVTKELREVLRRLTEAKP